MLNFAITSSKRLSVLCQAWFNHLWSYPSPASFNLNYTFGSLSLVALIIQILTGLLLTMHYAPNVDLAFSSVEHVMRDVTGGSILRYIHANGASFFFFCLYWHVGRAMYYKSFSKNGRAWAVGIVILVLVMAAAFFGYVLPWGQMSFWGATVITNLFSVIPLIGQDLVEWLWGGFGVGNPTLNRFYTFHFLVPFIILALVFVHLLVLHGSGSSTPNDSDHSGDGLTLGQYFIKKDVLFVNFFVAGYFLFVLFSPNFLNHSDNYIVANAMQTPPHIVPEWYLLPFYAILRAIPNKLLGVLAMGYSIVFLALLPWIALHERANPTHSPFHVTHFWIFAFAFLILGFVGGQPIYSPYTDLSIACVIIYFLYVPAYTAHAYYMMYTLSDEEADELYYNYGEWELEQEERAIALGHLKFVPVSEKN